MIMVEFKDDKEIIELRNKFLKTVIPTDNDEIIKQNAKEQEDVLIRLISAIGKRIGMDVEQMDIKNNIYWPQGFYDTIQQQQTLVSLLIENQKGISKILKRINDKEVVITVKPL